MQGSRGPQAMLSAPRVVDGRLAVSTSYHHAPIQYATTRQATTSSSPLLSTRAQTRSDSYNYGQPSMTAVHPGCVLCGIVASAAAQSSGMGSAPESPISGSMSLSTPVRAATPDLQRGQRPTGPPTEPYAPPVPASASSRVINVGPHKVIYRDDIITVYPAEGKEALCPEGRHLIIVLNQHLTSVYSLGPSDIPAISHMINTAKRLLLRSVAAPNTSIAERGLTEKDVRVGFVNGMPADPRSPHQHLHAQAFLGPFDKTLPGSTLWRRNIVFSYMNWWSLEDLRAEIREETSNCRVKSGYDDRQEAPIDKVPDAGAIEGAPNAMEPVHDAYADSPKFGSAGVNGVKYGGGEGNGLLGPRYGVVGNGPGPSKLRRNDSSRSDATVKAERSEEQRAFVSGSRSSSMSSNDFEVSSRSGSS